MTIIKFTSAESAALRDRLELSDVVAEALLDEDTAHDAQYIQNLIAAADRMNAAVAGDIDARRLDAAERAVLVEAIEGSTLVANSEDRAQVRAVRRVLAAAAKKLEAAGFGSINVPTN